MIKEGRLKVEESTTKAMKFKQAIEALEPGDQDFDTWRKRRVKQAFVCHKRCRFYAFYPLLLRHCVVMLCKILLPVLTPTIGVYPTLLICRQAQKDTHKVESLAFFLFC